MRPADVVARHRRDAGWLRWARLALLFGVVLLLTAMPIGAIAAGLVASAFGAALGLAVAFVAVLGPIAMA